MKRIAHITTVHTRRDTRIFLKQCRTLAGQPDYDVYLVVADGKGDAELDGVHIVDCGKASGGKFGRIIMGAWRVFTTTKRICPNVVHFHDPELIPVGFLLRLWSIDIVYDVHEDFPRQIRSNNWINPLIRWPISLGLPLIEWIAARVFTSVVTVTPKIAQRFSPNKTVIICNFPIQSEFPPVGATNEPSQNKDFAYVGIITPIRGAKEMVDAIGILNHSHQARLRLAGKFMPTSLEEDLRSLPAWQYTDFSGWADRYQIAQILSEVRAGLVVLHPTRNYPDAYPVKMFEYMSAGLPVIASNFPLWKSIVEDAGCGLLVDPRDSLSIASAMRWILENPDEAMAMGERGRKAIEVTYNWNPEAEKLITLYEKILNRRNADAT